MRARRSQACVLPRPALNVYIYRSFTPQKTTAGGLATSARRAALAPALLAPHVASNAARRFDATLHPAAPAAAQRRRVTAAAAAAGDEAGQGGGVAGGTVYEAEYDSACQNNVVLTGNMGRDWEFKTLPNGTLVASTSLAVSAGRDKTNWFNVVCYGAVSEELRAWELRKGARLVVHGRLAVDEWTDRATAQRRSAVKVVGTTVGVIPRGAGAVAGAGGGAAAGMEGDYYQQQQAQQPQYQAAQGQPQPQYDQQMQPPQYDPSQQPPQQQFYQQQPPPPQYDQQQQYAPPPQQQFDQQQPQYQQQQQAPAAPPPWDAEPAPAAAAAYPAAAAAPPPAGGAALPLPERGATKLEEDWLSLIRRPGDWWDNRASKTKPTQPDFKSKDGGAALWLTGRGTPAWVAPNLPPPRATQQQRGA